MRLLLLASFWASALVLAVRSSPIERLASAAASVRSVSGPDRLHSTLPALTLIKRMDPDPRDWAALHHYLTGPDVNLVRETNPDVLRQRYGHLIYHNNMPVFAANDVRSQSRLMQQSWADFGVVQVYGSPDGSSRGQPRSFRVSRLVPTDGVYSVRFVDDEKSLLDKLDYAHHLESRFGPHIKLVTMGLPLDTRSGFRSGGHSANRVWRANPERLSDYDAQTLRNKLNVDRFGLFISNDNQHLLGITIGNNGLARVEERLYSAAPVFAEASRRF